MIILLLLSLLVTPVEAASYPVFTTSYNPTKSQTDSSPCIGASGVDQCLRLREGGKVIALSQDLVGRAWWKPFRYHDVVYLDSDIPNCRGEFVVLDTLNKRFKNRADIFFLNRTENTSCKGTITKVQ